MSNHNPKTTKNSFSTLTTQKEVSEKLTLVIFLKLSDLTNKKITMKK